MSRYSDIHLRTLALTQPSLLPAIDWSQVGQTAPTIVSLNPSGPGDKLPKADAIVMTWTSAEWAAMRVSASSQEGLDAFAERRKPDFDAARAREAG